MQSIKIISSEKKKRDDGSVRLEYVFNVDDFNYTLWYEVDGKWGDYLNGELADPVIMAVLSYAIRGGYNIQSSLPVSHRLLFNLRAQVMPQLKLCTPRSFDIDIDAPISDEKYDSFATVTALSMGVDSFTTFFEYTVDCPPEADRITHLVFFENGDHRFCKDGEKICYEEQKNAVVGFCEKYGWELIVVRSNIDELLGEAFWNEGLVEMSTYKHVSTALSLQRLIKTYYYSASYNLDNFSCNLNEDVTDYEKWLLPLISTESTYFVSTNKAMSRIEKTKYISQFPETYDNLIVCCLEGRNCGKCNKCLRTELTLYKLGVLDKYSKSFDLDYFYKNINNAQKELFMWKNISAIDADVIDMLGKEIPLSVRIKGNMWANLTKRESLYKTLDKRYYKLTGKHMIESLNAWKEK